MMTGRLRCAGKVERTHSAVDDQSHSFQTCGACNVQFILLSAIGVELLENHKKTRDLPLKK
jgi:hypothetical protein